MNNLLLDTLKEIEELDIAGYICVGTVRDLYKKIESAITDEDVKGLSAVILYHTKEQLGLIDIDNTINYLYNTYLLAEVSNVLTGSSGDKDYSVVPNTRNTDFVLDMVYMTGSLCYSHFDDDGCAACPIKKSSLSCTGIMDLTDLYIARRDTILRMNRVRDVRRILIRQYELYTEYNERYSPLRKLSLYEILPDYAKGEYQLPINVSRSYREYLRANPLSELQRRAEINRKIWLERRQQVSMTRRIPLCGELQE